MNLKEQPTVKCEKCDSIFFEEVNIIKRISKILAGTPDDTLLPIPILRCTECKHVNNDMNPLKDDEPIQPPLFL